MREELGRIAAGTTRPYNVNFFCHAPPVPDAEREAAWRAALAPYYREFGLDLDAIIRPPRRARHSATRQPTCSATSGPPW